VDPTSSQSDKTDHTARIQAQNDREEVLKQKTLNLKKKKQDSDDREALKREIKQEVGEENVSERTRFAKEKGTYPRTGNSSVPGGTRDGKSAFDKVSANLRKTGGVMSSRGKAIQPQGKKKDKGAKGYQGQTPVDRIKARLANKRAPQPNPYKPRAGESD